MKLQKLSYGANPKNKNKNNVECVWKGAIWCFLAESVAAHKGDFQSSAVF